MKIDARAPKASLAPSVRVSRLEYTYPDGRHALRGIDLAIAAEESVALVGPNGAGKSTLLLHLNGILPGKARRGVFTHSHGLEAGSRPIARSGPAVWIDGLPVDDRNLREARRKVGLLFQDPDDQLFCNTVLEDVAFGPRNLGMTADQSRRRALDCLARVGLTEAADRPPHHLSFGERRRVGLAGVLACDPVVLALDEPTANLDPRARRRFIELLGGISGIKLIATHDLEMVLELCPRTVLLDGGKVVADGPTRSILDDAVLLEKHGLERPLSLELRARFAEERRAWGEAPGDTP